MRLSGQWTQANGPYAGNTYSLAAVSDGQGGTSLFAGTTNGVFRSSDWGGNWYSFSSGLTNHSVRALAVFPGAEGAGIFAGTHDGIFRSTDYGETWEDVSTGLTDSIIHITTFLVKGEQRFAATFGGGVFLSTDNGSSWNGVNSGLTNDMVMSLLSVSDDADLPAIQGGVYRSINGGDWTAINNELTGTNVYSLALDGENVYAGTSSGVFQASIIETTWASIGGDFSGFTVPSLLVVGPHLLAGTTGKGVWSYTLESVSTFAVSSRNLDYGVVPVGSTIYDSISVVNTGTDTLIISSITSSNTHFTVQASDLTIPPLQERYLAVTFEPLNVGSESGAVVFTHNTSGSPDTVMVAGEGEVVSSAEQDQQTIPQKFSLSQNYPNPFNPTTIIRYELPREARVRLALYDLTGRKVRVLVDAVQPAGYHSIAVRAEGLASGAYLYRIETEGFVAVRRLVIVK